MSDQNEAYGVECIIDVHDCTGRFNRSSIERFCRKLCDLLEMVPEDLCFWDYEGDSIGYENAPSHLKGTSAVQFIRTSNITIHALDDLQRLYLNVFSCKRFDTDALKQFVQSWTHGSIKQFVIIPRK